MKLSVKKILSVALVAVMAFSLAACGKTPAPAPEPEKYVYVPYNATHTSTSQNNFVNFVSSDPGLDAFINEYAERHMRSNPSNSIHPGSLIGAGQTGWKDMESKVSGWWNVIPANGMTDNYMYNWIQNGRQDNQGYVWCDNGTELDSWCLGWALPTYSDGGKAFSFSGSDDVKAWTVGETADDLTKDDSKFTKKYEGINGNGYLAVQPKEGVDSITLTAEYGIVSWATPFLRMGFSYAPAEGDDVEDLYVYYQTSSDETWSEDKKVAFSDYCLDGFEIGGNTVHKQGYFFPMYLQKKWSESRSRYITKLRLSFKAKEGKKLSGKLLIDYIASDYDDRQMQYPAFYITSAKNFLSYKRDKNLLAQALPKARAAMNFLLNQGGGKDGLVSQGYFYGHSALGYQQKGTGIGSGYWDVIALPQVNLMMNTAYYNALGDMIYLEEMAKAMNLPEAEQSVTTVNANMDGTHTYTAETADSLYALRDAFPAKFQAEFWNEKTQRFHAGHYDNKGAEPMDHGYLTFNEQAVIAGLATPAQAKSIMQWINGDRNVNGDNSQGDDIYFFDCAPRANTQHIGTDFYWNYSSDFGKNVENGGSGVHLSYYDIVAQSKVDNSRSFSRLKNIQSWYEKVKSAGGEGTQFYRAYYNNSALNTKGINLQGGGTSGALGLDWEFLEAGLLFCAIPDAYFGLGTTAAGALTFKPNLPKGLDWWRMENLTYGGTFYDVSIGKYFFEISEVKPIAANGTVTTDPIKVTMRVPGFDYELFVNDQKVEPALNGDGTFTVTLPFASGRVEIKGPPPLDD